MTTLNKAIKIIQTIHDNNRNAVFAGGCVRDYILHKEPNDYDIATDAYPDELEAMFKKTIPIGKSFGIITVIMDGEPFEVATFRSDGEYLDGRRPSSVSFCSMKEDAKRRDFTINGLFYDPLKDEILDFVDGEKDLHNETIRFIGNPIDRINEDRLRILRAVRFAVKLGFAIDEESWKAVKENAHRIVDISKERIRDELNKMFSYRKFRKTLNLLKISGLLHYILPEVEVLKGCEQNPGFHPEGDVWEHTIRALENLPEDVGLEIMWATLLHDVGKPPTVSIDPDGRIRNLGHAKVGADMTLEILQRLKFSNDFIDHVCVLIKNHMNMKHIKHMKKSTLKKFLAQPHFADLMVVCNADTRACGGTHDWYEFATKRLAEWKPEEIKPEPIMRGRHLIELGLKPGPIFSKILNDVMDRQLEEEITTLEEAINYVKENYGI